MVCVCERFYNNHPGIFVVVEVSAKIITKETFSPFFSLSVKIFKLELVEQSKCIAHQ